MNKEEAKKLIGEKLNEFREKAIAGIMEFPESEARTALIELVNYSTTRQK